MGEVKTMIEIKGTNNSVIVYADEIENAVWGQLTALCNSPAMSGTQIRVMPDVHAGSWVVGTTIRFKERIIPALIGTDIGCGVLRVPFTAKGKLDFNKLDKIIKDSVPSGMMIRKNRHKFANRIDLSQLKCAKHIQQEKALLSMGTLGGGNHFIEIDVDDDKNFYLIIHTGSRHLGAEVAKWHQDTARPARMILPISLPGLREDYWQTICTMLLCFKNLHVLTVWQLLMKSVPQCVGRLSKLRLRILPTITSVKRTAGTCFARGQLLRG